MACLSPRDSVHAKKILGRKFDDSLFATVFGRESCGCCSQFMVDCAEAGIAYTLVSCDEAEGSQQMWSEFEAA